MPAMTFNTMKTRLLSYFVLLSVCLSQGCVDAFDPKLALNADLVVVSAIITDQAGPQLVSLSRSRSRADSANVTTPISRATVTVLVNKTPVVLAETATDPGTYQFPTGFRGKVGDTYQLQFQTPEGVSYASSVETMAAASPVARAYSVFNPTGIKVTADAVSTPTNDVFIDFTDPADQRNFYFWRWRLHELQDWCATCTQGRYLIKDIGPVGSGPIDIIGCVSDKKLSPQNKFDYDCRGTCWEIFYSNTINIMSDIYTNGTPQTRYKVATIPIYQREPALVTVEQLSISANAYRYYRLVAEQSQKTGTLADSPPAPLAGNVRNQADPTENVVGYFSAAGMSTAYHKMSRNDVPAGNFRGLFFAQNGRKPNVDVAHGTVFIGQGIPSALCVPGQNRTNKLPPGWNQ